MPTRLSNTRKHRGHVSAGHGRVGKQYVAPSSKLIVRLEMGLQNLPLVVRVERDLTCHCALALATTVDGEGSRQKGDCPGSID